MYEAMIRERAVASIHQSECLVLAMDIESLTLEVRMRPRGELGNAPDLACSRGCRKASRTVGCGWCVYVYTYVYVYVYVYVYAPQASPG